MKDQFLYKNSAPWSSFVYVYMHCTWANTSECKQLHLIYSCMYIYTIFSNQLVNPATSSPADDVHYYVIPPKLLLTNRFYFQQTSGIHAPVGKRKGGSLSGRSPAHIADSSNVATIARKHSVLNSREINRNNTHTALASVLTNYGWIFLIF
jgi:hypothetical protein